MSDQLTLNDVCTMIVDCEHKTAPEAITGQKYGFSIGTSSIRDGRMILGSAKPVDRQTFRLWSARATLQKDDIILTREAPAGQAALVDGTVPVCLGQRTVLLRSNKDMIEPRYLHYRLLAPELQERMHSRSEGSTVAHLNVQDIRGLPVGQLPDLPEQKAIAVTLGALDDKIAVNDRIVQTSFDIAEGNYVRLQDGATRSQTVGQLIDLRYGKALPAVGRVPGRFLVYGSGGITGTHNECLVPGTAAANRRVTCGKTVRRRLRALPGPTARVPDRAIGHAVTTPTARSGTLGPALRVPAWRPHRGDEDRLMRSGPNWRLPYWAWSNSWTQGDGRRCLLVGE